MPSRGYLEPACSVDIILGDLGLRLRGNRSLMCKVQDLRCRNEQPLQGPMYNAKDALTMTDAQA